MLSLSLSRTIPNFTPPWARYPHSFASIITNALRLCLQQRIGRKIPKSSSASLYKNYLSQCIRQEMTARCDFHLDIMRILFVTTCWTWPHNTLWTSHLASWTSSCGNALYASFYPFPLIFLYNISLFLPYSIWEYKITQLGLSSYGINRKRLKLRYENTYILSAAYTLNTPSYLNFCSSWEE